MLDVADSREMCKDFKDFLGYKGLVPIPVSRDVIATDNLLPGDMEGIELIRRLIRIRAHDGHPRHRLACGAPTASELTWKVQILSPRPVLIENTELKDVPLRRRRS